MKLIKIIIAFLFPVFLIITGYQTIISDRAESELEYRTLAQFPDIEFINLMKGEYSKSIEAAFSDQFYKRDWYVDKFYDLNLNILKQRRLGSIVCKGDDLYKYDEPVPYAEEREKIYNDAVLAASELNKIADFAAKKGSRLIILDFPNKSVAQSESLGWPYNSLKDLYDIVGEAYEDTLSDDVEWIELKEKYDKIDKTGMSFYYHSDHHWNFFGAYLAYNALMDSFNNFFDYSSAGGQKLLKYEDFTFAEKTLQGSYSRLIAYSMGKDADRLQIFTSKDWDKPNKRFESGKSSIAPIITNEYPAYRAYMSGDWPETRIETYQKGLPNVLICGYSFTNLLEALIYSSCDTMISLDYRANEKEDIYFYIETERPDFVILVLDRTETTTIESVTELTSPTKK